MTSFASRYNQRFWTLHKKTLTMAAKGLNKMKCLFILFLVIKKKLVSLKKNKI